MDAISQISYSLDVNATSSPMQSAIGRQSTLLAVAIVVATGATIASLGVALYTGWQSGGPLLERVIRMIFASVAVLFVHWLPVGWPAFRSVTRLAVAALWTVAITVVLYGQATFFMISQQHAGDQRAATVPGVLVSTPTHLPASRSRTEIAKAAAKVSTDLARAQAQQCVGDCPMLKVRQARLAAELKVLNAQAGEAMRREASEDRRNAQADRIDALRERLRTDPVAFAVATWLGTTAHDFELIIGLAHAVVLEGAAIIGWLLVSVALGRAAGVSDRQHVRSDLAGGHETITLGRKAAAPECDADTPGQAVAAGESAGSLVTSEDELGLKKIHEAVLTGQIKPTQEAIRKLLRCGQRKAGSLSRQFHARFGSMCRQECDVRRPGLAKPAVADVPRGANVPIRVHQNGNVIDSSPAVQEGSLRSHSQV